MQARNGCFIGVLSVRARDLSSLAGGRSTLARGMIAEEPIVEDAGLCPEHGWRVWEPFH